MRRTRLAYPLICLFWALVLIAFNLTDAGALRDSSLGDVIAAASAACALCILAGLVFRKPAVLTTGLALTAGVFLTRSVFLILVNWSAIGVWLGTGIAATAAVEYIRVTHEQEWGRI